MISKITKQFLFFFLVLSSTVTKGQPLPEFPQDSAQWITHYFGYPGYCCTDPSDYFDTLYCYTMKGDTTIGSLNYKKLKMFKRSAYLGTPTLSAETVIGALRYDSVLNEVFYYDNSIGSEDLAYKFDLSAGDNFMTNYTPQPFDSLIARTVDSTIIFTTYSGMQFTKNVRYLVFGNCGWPGLGSLPAIINNIGCSFGLLERLCPVEFNMHELQCFSGPGDPPAFSPYEVLTSAGVQPDEAGFTIYPSPAKDVLYLKSPEQAIESIRIFNTLGEQLQETEGSSARLDVQWLPAGIYFIRVSAGNRIFVKRFIKT
jgi:hypothetical protein